MTNCRSCGEGYDESNVSPSQIRRKNCPKCLKAKAKESYESRKNGHKEQVKSKHCIACDRELPASNFTTNTNSSDGKSSQCKECLSLYRKTKLSEYHSSIRLNGKRSKTLKKYNDQNKETILSTRRKNYARSNQSMKSKRQENLERAVKLLGGQCIKCGISDISKLAIDHIHSNGNLERQTVKWELTVKNILTNSNRKNEYQILCHNHNFEKHLTNKKERPVVPDIRVRLCLGCDRNKFFHEFVKDRYKKQGIKSECKDCARKRHQFIKELAIRDLGGKCAECGESNMVYLCVDHVNNDGSEKRKSGEHNSIYSRINLKLVQLDELQILCWNCNASKEYFRRRTN
jgi:hypothetical protein